MVLNSFGYCPKYPGVGGRLEFRIDELVSEARHILRLPNSFDNPILWNTVHRHPRMAFRIVFASIGEYR
jgi:hypothetical protein